MISKADKKDIPQLTQLVNRSYRGESSRKGWTTEADLFDGNRMSETVLQQMMDTPGAVVYKYEEAEKLIGCVYLRKENDDVYLGMLTVSPGVQAKGIGKQLLFFAEDAARQMDGHRIYMKVIDIRTELIDWYLRHGYTDTKERIPFKGDGTDTPKEEIFFAVLEKVLHVQ